MKAGETPMTTRPTGRPPGKDYPKARTLLLTEEDMATLQRLAEAWSCSGAEVVRRLIRAEGQRLERARKRR
jgi:hypothetical protein